MSDKDHSHTPYVVLLLHAVAAWRSSKEGLPKAFAEKKAFKAEVETMQRATAKEKKLNVQEAVTNAYRAYGTHRYYITAEARLHRTIDVVHISITLAHISRNALCLRSSFFFLYSFVNLFLSLSLFLAPPFGSTTHSTAGALRRFGGYCRQMPIFSAALRRFLQFRLLGLCIIGVHGRRRRWPAASDGGDPGHGSRQPQVSEPQRIPWNFFFLKLFFHFLDSSFGLFTKPMLKMLHFYQCFKLFQV